MTLAVFQEQIETEREWRESEIRFLHNVQEAMDLADRQRVRRSIICLLYAHVEGFVKFAFSLYIDQINNQSLKCKDVSSAIAAAAFSKEFKALKDVNKKSAFFINSLPDDKHLHSFAREKDFVSSIENFFEHPVIIGEDYINTENNVGREVIEKMLFQVGLAHTDLRDVYGPLNRLLNVRNDIAHGKRKQGIEDADYQIFLDCCRSVIEGVSRRLTTAYGGGQFRR